MSSRVNLLGKEVKDRYFTCDTVVHSLCTDLLPPPQNVTYPSVPCLYALLNMPPRVRTQETNTPHVQLESESSGKKHISLLALLVQKYKY